VNHYIYRVAWSPYHGQYVGSCLELPFMRREAPTAQEAIEEVETAVDRHIEIMGTATERYVRALRLGLAAPKSYEASALLSSSLTGTGSFSVSPTFDAPPGEPSSVKKSALICRYWLCSSGRSSS
jgi:hypothetical protein